MYKGMTDELNRMVFVHLQKDPLKGKLIQTGFYDKDILCHECERDISKLEDYAARVLYEGSPGMNIQKFITADGMEFLDISGLNHDKFKLFLLSIVWRGHISKRN